MSANLEATIHLESLLEDEDLHKNIKRAEFEEIIAPMVEKFGKVLQDAWILSGKLSFINLRKSKQEWNLFFFMHKFLVSLAKLLFKFYRHRLNRLFIWFCH